MPLTIGRKKLESVRLRNGSIICKITVTSIGPDSAEVTIESPAGIYTDRMSMGERIGIPSFHRLASISLSSVRTSRAKHEDTARIRFDVPSSINIEMGDKQP